MSRADRLAALLEGRGLHQLLVAAPVNLRYVTGFCGSNGLALVGAERRTFVTDFRYVEQAAAQVPDFDRVRGEQDLLEALVAALPADGVLRLGFDDEHTSVRAHARLRAALPEHVELVPSGGLVEELRAVKEPAELDAIRAAAALADEIYEWVLERGLVGRTEREVAVELEHELRRRGAEGPSFPSIVASGAHGALPHAEPRAVEIPSGVLVTIDLGARLDGYCSDCTRTFATGPLAGDGEAIYALVLEAQEAALAALAPGKTGAQVDAVARDLIVAAGHGEHFGHGLGHGVGLEVHERPRLATTATAELDAGNVVTVEPGVYVPGDCGVRIEDLVIVTEAGHELVSHFPKTLSTVL